MKTYKKGRPSKRKVSKNGPSKKNKTKKTKKMKKIKGGSVFSEKCIPLVMESGNVKRAMQNILCGLEMYMTGVSSKPYGINIGEFVKDNKDKTHIEVVTDDNQGTYIKITDMLYRESEDTTLYRNEKTGLQVSLGEKEKPIVQSLSDNKTLEPYTKKLKLINHLESIPIGKSTGRKPTYTRDDDPKSFHNTPIFYMIRTSVNISDEWDMDDLQNSLNKRKNKIYNEHISTYNNAIQRLTTNSVCNEMLRKIIGKTQSKIPETITIELQVGNKYKSPEKSMGNKSPEESRGDTSLLGNNTITVQFPIGNFVPERSQDAKN
jgi:hypothetical protein